MSATGGASLAGRVALAAQVALLLVLAVVVAVFLIHLSGRPSLRIRRDLTLDQRNTLDERTETLLDRLPEAAKVEVFFEPLPGEYAAVVSEAQRRVLRLLQLAEDARDDKFELVLHDVREFSTYKARADELGVRQSNVVVVSMGEAREILTLTGDLVEIDPGEPGRIPATVSRFHGESALAEALATVATGTRPIVYVTQGHREPSLDDSGNFGGAGVRQLLEADGFQVETWDPSVEPTVPEDADLVAVIGPDQPWPSESVDLLERWVREGGRLFCAVGDTYVDGPNSAGDLLSRFGVHVDRAYMCEPVIGPGGRQLEGVDPCREITVVGRQVNRQHPVTATLAGEGVALGLPRTRSFQKRAASGDAGSLRIDLASTAQDAWRDLPDSRGRFDNAYEPTREEYGAQVVAIAATFEVESEQQGRPPVLEGLGESSVEGRVVAVGTGLGFMNLALPYNRFFFENACNWLSERELRIQIPPRDPSRRRLDVYRGAELTWVFYVIVLGLPLGCLGVGIGVFSKRRLL